MHLVWFLVIGAVAGWLASKIMKGKSSGLLRNLILGVVGAVVGGWLFRMLGFSAEGSVAELITALAGALVVLFIAGLLDKD